MNYSKFILLNLVFFCMILNVSAQSYSRLSFTPLFLSYKDGSIISANFYDSIKVPDRFDYNYIDNPIITVPFEKTSYFPSINNENFNQNIRNSFSAIKKAYKRILISEEKKLSEPDSIRNSVIKKVLINSKISNKILYNLLIDSNLGYMTPEIISKRALYNTTDAEYRTSLNTEIKLDFIKTKGISLLKNLYLFIYDIYDESATPINNLDRRRTFTAKGNVYIYKIDVDSLIDNKIFDNLIFTEKDAIKLRTFNSFYFPIKFVRKYEENINVLNYYLTNNSKPGSFSNSASIYTNIFKNVVKPDIKTEDLVYSELINHLIENSVTSFDEQNSSGLITSSIFSTKPLSAKIGLKEGLKREDLFKVTEFVDLNNGNKKEKNIGWIRLKKVSDNRHETDGNTDPSRFYRISSKKIHKGMKITYVKNKGFDFGITYALSDSFNLCQGPLFFIDINPKLNSFSKTTINLSYVPSILPQEVLFNNINVSNILKFKGSNIYVDATYNLCKQFNHIEFSTQLGYYTSNISINRINDVEITSSSIYKGLEGLQIANAGFLAGLKIAFNFGPHFQFVSAYKYGFGLSSNMHTNSGKISFDGVNPIDLKLNYNTPNSLIFGFRILGF